MNLRDALLCIDCDEVFIVEGSTCNPRCPNCASSVFAPLSAWIETWKCLEKQKSAAADSAAYGGASTRRARMEIVRPAVGAA